MCDKLDGIPRSSDVTNSMKENADKMVEPLQLLKKELNILDKVDPYKLRDMAEQKLLTVIKYENCLVTLKYAIVDARRCVLHV